MNITVYMHDNSTIKADVTDYDAQTVTQQLNDQRLLMVAFGDVIINKNSVKMIAPTPTDTPA